MEIRKLVLNNGLYIPIIGIGTIDSMYGVKEPKLLKMLNMRILNGFYYRTFYKLERKRKSLEMLKSIVQALKSGYRLIDTSAAYSNEWIIKEAIQMSQVQRNEIFLISRVSNRQQYSCDIREACFDSLKKLGTDYLDLYMFHWPVTNHFVNTWKQMEVLYKEGYVKSIGVANCHVHHLNSILQECTVIPAINEFEIHPLFNQKELIRFCSSKNIAVIAYTPIGRFHEKIRNNVDLISLSNKYNKTIPQIILRWHYQNGIISIPRSSNKNNIKTNFDIFDFDLQQNEIVLIDNVNENLRLRFDPDNCDFTKL